MRDSTELLQFKNVSLSDQSDHSFEPDDDDRDKDYEYEHFSTSESSPHSVPEIPEEEIRDIASKERDGFITEEVGYRLDGKKAGTVKMSKIEEVIKVSTYLYYYSWLSV